MADDPRFLPATERTLQQLSQTECPSGNFISVIIDLDPTQFGTPQARQTQINSTLTDLAAKVERANLEHDPAEAARRDIERIRDRFGGPRIDDADGAGALAVFCCETIDTFDVIRLSGTVAAGSAIGTGPNLEPITELLNGRSWIVALISRRVMRVFRGNADTLRELADLESYVHGQHSAGGWSQKRFERGIDKEVQDHLIVCAETLYKMRGRFPDDRLLIGCTQELFSLIEETLHPEVAKMVEGRIDVDVEDSSIEQILDASAPAIDEFERARERAVLDRLAQELGRGGRAVASENDVRRALTEKRVEVLVLDDPEGAGDEIDMALEQSADVLVVRHHDDLRELGSIAALLRF